MKDMIRRMKLHPWFYPILLILFTLGMVWLILPAHAVFGSEGDWISQHAAIAEQFRTIFYETGQIFPDFSLLGACSNIYDFSYYGFLRPDVLISFLLPRIPMAYIISAYAILELVVGAVLCYHWLRQHLTVPFWAFIGGILYACAACFYHAHHQIIFVNYMPFLILALLGVRRLIVCGKHGLLTVSMFLIYLHSYYFAPAALVVIGLYFVYSISEDRYSMDRRMLACKIVSFLFSIAFSIGMAAILLLPTGLDLLSTQKDAGVPAAFSEIFSLELSMEGLLYHPYGCGLTILCLYTLLLGIRRKSTRWLSLLLLLFLTVNIFPYLFSGFLYVRYKVLIPLLPLLLLLCVRALEELSARTIRHSLPCALGCLVPVLYSKYRTAMLLDIALIILTFLIIWMYQRRPASDTGKLTLPLYLMLCLFPAAASVVVGQRDAYIPIASIETDGFTQEERKELVQDSRYRFDCLTQAYENANTMPVPGMGRTTMYSSVTDSHYADFVYRIMRNPIRARNRVSLTTDANPCFSYLMGIRYIETESGNIPWGYEPVARKGETVIAENSHVLPVAYTGTAQMNRQEFEKLAFPYSIEALTRYTITDSSRGPTARAFMEGSRITPVSIESLTGLTLPELLPAAQTDEQDTFAITLEEKTTFTLPLSSPLEHHILICSFGVAAPSGDELTIDINGIRNKRSGKTAPYPNHNDVFTYQLSSNEPITELTVTLSPGKYVLSDFQFWLMNTSHWGNDTVNTVDFQSSAGNELFRGTSSRTEDCWCVTSYPFRQGYKVLVDGAEVTAQSVNQGFVGFPLTAGTHEIIIRYTPPGKTAAAWISLLSMLLFAGSLLWARKYKQSNHKKRGML